MAALLAGQPVTAAAGAADVARETVHRWLKDDFQFRAAYNAARNELRDAWRVKLDSLAEKAIHAVERAISANDAKAALVVLRGLGLLDGKAPASAEDDPDKLKDAAEERKKEEVRSKRFRDSINSMFDN